ncbi:MAG: replication-relaxation family protein [Candidatus Moraniibacteriota bacterium]
MRQERGSASSKLSWGEKNRAVGRIFLEHALLVSEVMVALELACRQSGSIRLISEEELFQEKAIEVRSPFQWRVKIQGSGNLGVVPDRVFALEFPDEKGKNRIHFFLEADRGTMPVKRRHLYQTSMYRKFLAYEATWSQSIHQKKFGFNRFRVLTVTASATRVKSLVEACAGLKRGHGLYLFADRTILEKPESILSTTWSTGRRDETTTLLS